MQQPSLASLPNDTVKLLSDSRAPFARVFVPVDFSSECHRTVGVALELQRVYGSAVCLFRVQHDEGADEFLGGLGAVQDERVPDAVEALARFVDNIAPGASSSVELRARVGDAGEKAALVFDEAAAWKATLIVVTNATHRMLFSSVAERLVRKAAVAVLALPVERAP
jgi:nucleotide-binding universal stress UspA family protein